MDILLAKPRGFCAGVNRAIAIVQQALGRCQPPIYVLHEIVHNTHVLNSLRAMGVIFVEELGEIPTGAVVIFSAHGVSRTVAQEAIAQGLRTVDATCPLVSKVHHRMQRLTAQGYEVLVIGHKGHPEVEGTWGQVKGPIQVISQSAMVDDVQVADPARVAYVTQTTLSVDETKHILDALRKRFPQISGPAHTDICYATTNRQAAVHNLAQQVDLVLIVGSKNSSNSNRLREVAEQCRTPAYLIDDAGDLDADWFEGVDRVGISAGASAPEYLVKDVVAWLQTLRPSTVREMDGLEENACFPVPNLQL